MVEVGIVFLYDYCVIVCIYDEQIGVIVQVYVFEDVEEVVWLYVDEEYVGSVVVVGEVDFVQYGYVFLVMVVVVECLLVVFVEVWCFFCYVGDVVGQWCKDLWIDDLVFVVQQVFLVYVWQ